MINTVIFDMDGVIFDTERLAHRCWLEVARQNRIKDMDKIYPAIIGCNHSRAVEILLNYYGENFPVENFLQDTRRTFNRYIDTYGVPIKAGVTELLMFLKTNGYMTALASSSDRAIVEKELKSVNIYKYFDKIVCGDQVTHSKPDPEIFLKAVSALKSKKRESMVIEDSYNGLQAAVSAGVTAVMVPDMLPPTEELIGAGVKVFPNLLSVKVALKENKIK